MSSLSGFLAFEIVLVKFLFYYSASFEVPEGELGLRIVKLKLRWWYWYTKYMYKNIYIYMFNK